MLGNCLGSLLNRGHRLSRRPGLWGKRERAGRPAGRRHLFQARPRLREESARRRARVGERARTHAPSRPETRTWGGGRRVLTGGLGYISEWGKEGASRARGLGQCLPRPRPGPVVVLRDQPPTPRGGHRRSLAPARASGRGGP